MNKKEWRALEISDKISYNKAKFKFIHNISNSGNCRNCPIRYEAGKETPQCNYSKCNIEAGFSYDAVFTYIDEIAPNIKEVSESSQDTIGFKIPVIDTPDIPDNISLEQWHKYNNYAKFAYMNKHSDFLGNKLNVYQCDKCPLAFNKSAFKNKCDLITCPITKFIDTWNFIKDSKEISENEITKEYIK